MPHLQPRPGWRKWLPRHPMVVGRRGQIQLLLGSMWVLEGVSLLGYPRGGVDALHIKIPESYSAAAWIITGCLAIASAIRPPGVHDHWGFSALYLMPAVRLLSYGASWVASWGVLDFPPWVPAYPDSWRFVAIYGAMVGVIMVCAGWPEPPRRPTRGS